MGRREKRLYLCTDIPKVQDTANIYSDFVLT